MFFGYFPADLAAAAESGRLQSIDYQARAEATKYENRQLALKSVAATTADASVAAAPAAPVTGTISILASGAALIDQAVTTGHVDIVDGILTAVPAFRLAKTAAALRLSPELLK